MLLPSRRASGESETFRAFQKDESGMKVLTGPGLRTGTYFGLFSQNGELKYGVGDMDIFTLISIDQVSPVP